MPTNVEISCEPDRGEDAHVALPRNDDPFAAHGEKL